MNITFGEIQDMKTRFRKAVVHSSLLALLIVVSSIWNRSRNDAYAIVPTAAVSTSINGKIAFSSKRDGNDEIYMMNADGTGQTRMTNHLRSDYDPVWSPDGKRIAFVSTRSGNPDIWVMDAIPSTPTQLTNDAAVDDNPEWSPDGTRIAFRSTRTGNSDIWFLKVVSPSPQLQLTTNTKEDIFPTWSPNSAQIAFASNRYNNNYDIWVMNANATNQINLTPNNPTTDTAPAWFGDKIAFQTNRDGNDEIYVMNANGSIQSQTRYTNHSASDSLPEWSPDGTKIAFTSKRSGNPDIWVMDATPQSVPAQRTVVTQADEYPTWSTREKILFQSNRSGNNDIWVMNADGTGQTNLTLNPAPDLDPCWSPDRTRIAFSSKRGSGYYAIWVMNADGSMPVQLSNPTTGDDRLPCWSPDGSRIAFASNRTGNYDIFVMNINPVSPPTNVTQNSAQDMFPTWSPSSTPGNSKIAFVTNRDGNDEIYKVSISSANTVIPGTLTNLTNNIKADDTPSWSPDGTKIAFASNRLGSSSSDYDIYVLPASGTPPAPTRLTQDTNGWQEYSPTWSPDGSQIAFRSIRNMNRAIYLINTSGPMDVNGNNEVALTTNTASDDLPNWFNK